VDAVNEERTIATTTHGRYVIDIAAGDGPRPLLVGFHGYAEQAALQLERLRAVRGDRRWSLVAVQALHRFYRNGSNDQVAASWMTREDRELAVADNVAYIDAVLREVARDCHEISAVVFAGFSQGASMAYRAAALGTIAAAGVIALGGDIPPELPQETLARIPRALIGWGTGDRFYVAAMRQADEDRLRQAGVEVTVAPLDAGHKWTDDFSEAVSEWLRPIA
jgi:predicted esterase